MLAIAMSADFILFWIWVKYDEKSYEPSGLQAVSICFVCIIISPMMQMDMVSALNRGLAGVHVSCASAEMITEDMTDNMHNNMTRKTDISLTRKYINNYFVSELYFLKFARICNLRQYEQINVIVRRDFGFYAYRMRFFQDSCRTSYK